MLPSSEIKSPPFASSSPLLSSATDDCSWPLAAVKITFFNSFLSVSVSDSVSVSVFFANSVSVGVINPVPSLLP